MPTRYTGNSSAVHFAFSFFPCGHGTRHKKTSRRNSEKFLVKLSKVGRSTFFDLFSQKIYNPSLPHCGHKKIVRTVVMAIPIISRALTEKKFKNGYVPAFKIRLKPFRKLVEPFRVMDRQEGLQTIFRALRRNFKPCASQRKIGKSFAEFPDFPQPI